MPDGLAAYGPLIFWPLKDREYPGLLWAVNLLASKGRINDKTSALEKRAAFPLVVEVLFAKKCEILLTPGH